MAKMPNEIGKRIVDLAADPDALEELYREHPVRFSEGLPVALAADPTAILLRAWRARLAVNRVAERSSVRSDARLWFVVALCAVGCFLAKLPAIFPRLDKESFYERNFSFFILPALAAYFIGFQKVSWRRAAVIVILFLAAAIAINGYPWKAGLQSDSSNLACLALPLFLWSIVGWAYGNTRWSDPNLRIGFLRLNGEAIINCALILITGALLTGITLGLFAAIHLDVDEWYFNWIVICGLVSAPIVAMHLAIVRAQRAPLAPLLARIFTPLALLTLLIYLGAMAWEHRSPFSDREFLIVFNVMLVAVLGLVVFDLCERKANRFLDLNVLALIAVALVIDLVALSAIGARLSKLGFSPNRTVTLGTNLLVLVNLLGILASFWREHRAREAVATKMWIARFLSIYGAWTAVIAFLLPWVFRFR